MPFERWLHVIIDARCASLVSRPRARRRTGRGARLASRSTDRGQRRPGPVAGGGTPRRRWSQWAACSSARKSAASLARIRLVEECAQDVRYAVRSLSHAPRLHPCRDRYAHARHRRQRRGVRGRQRRAAAAAAFPAAGSALPRRDVAAESFRQPAGPLGSQLRGVARPRPGLREPGDLLHVRWRSRRRRRSGRRQGGQRHDGILRRPGRPGGVRADLQR